MKSRESYKQQLTKFNVYVINNPRAHIKSKEYATYSAAVSLTAINGVHDVFDSQMG